MIAGAREALAHEDLHILVVDDAIPDGTGALAEQLGAEVLHRPRKLGLGSAYVAGFTRALAHDPELVCQMDADGSHDPADLPRLIALARDGADLALGSRYVPGGGVAGWHPARRAISRAGCLYARTVLRVPVRDLTGGLKTWRAGALRAIEPATRALAGLRLPGRADPSRAAPRPAGGRDPDRVPRARRRPLEDDAEDRPRGGVARAGAALILGPVAADTTIMNTENMALVQGWADTRDALSRWAARPGHSLRPWALGSLAIALLLLTLTWVIAKRSTPDLTRVYFPGLYAPAELGDFGFVLYRNGLVLALHGFACVAGFMAGSSLPQVAEGYSGVWRWIHDKAGPLAIGFVDLPRRSSRSPRRRGRSAAPPPTSRRSSTSPPALLLIALSLHAVPELFALFLPLAAWTIASRRKRWNELLAATFVTVAIAIPIVIAAAAVETWVTPGLLRWLAG